LTQFRQSCNGLTTQTKSNDSSSSSSRVCWPPTSMPGSAIETGMPIAADRQPGCFVTLYQVQLWVKLAGGAHRQLQQSVHACACRSVACNPTELTTRRTCRPFQTAAVMAAAREVLGPGPARLTPCQLAAYLRQRTLWLIG
jgi:hypothetical protein